MDRPHISCGNECFYYIMNASQRFLREEVGDAEVLPEQKKNEDFFYAGKNDEYFRKDSVSVYPGR